MDVIVCSGGHHVSVAVRPVCWVCEAAAEFEMFVTVNVVCCEVLGCCWIQCLQAQRCYNMLLTTSDVKGVSVC